MAELNVMESVDNLVNLTPREHKFVHKILSRAFPAHVIARAYNLKYQRGGIAVIDIQQGKQMRITTDEYYSNKDRYKTHSTGFTNLFTPDGISTRVSVADIQHLKSIGWTHILSGKKKPDGFQEKLRAANLGKKHTDATKKKLRDFNLGKSSKLPSEKTDPKIIKSRLGMGAGRKWSEQSLAKVTETRKLLLWINNGSINKRVLEEDLIKFPDFTKGRLKKLTQR